MSTTHHIHTGILIIAKTCKSNRLIKILCYDINSNDEDFGTATKPHDGTVIPCCYTQKLKKQHAKCCFFLLAI